MHCGSWQLAANQQVEFLIGTAQFKVGLQGYRIVTLHQRIEEFMHRNRCAFLEAFGEVVALHHARHSVARGQLNHAAAAKRIAPF